MTSFEDRYRKKSSVPEAPELHAMDMLKEAADTAEEYKAYNSVPHRKSKLWVRPNSANPFAHLAIPYSLCNHMIYDGSGFVIALHYNAPVICVTLQGRNLEELYRKLLDDEVDWVMEFDARKWATPGEHEPCITGIEVTHAPLPWKRADDALPGEGKEPGAAAKH